VRLATDIYRPARAGHPLNDRRPVLQTETTPGECPYFAARGYVVVNQHCRGCFGSEGEDGADTIAWPASSPGATARWGPFSSVSPLLEEIHDGGRH
jgi:predicted acyl esterase